MILNLPSPFPGLFSFAVRGIMERLQRTNKKGVYIMKERTYSQNIANAIKEFLTNDDWYFSFDEKRGLFGSLCG